MSTAPALQILAGLALPAIAALGLCLMKRMAQRPLAAAAETEAKTAAPVPKGRARKVCHATFPDVWAGFHNLAAVAVLGLVFLLCLILLGGWSR